MTAAICVKCGHRDNYETTRETRLSDLLCNHCGTGRLVQAGKNPSHAARATMRRMGETVHEPIMWRTKLSVADMPDIRSTAEIEHPPDPKKGGFEWALHGAAGRTSGKAKSFADARAKVEDQVQLIRDNLQLMLGKKPE